MRNTVLQNCVSTNRVSPTRAPGRGQIHSRGASQRANGTQAAGNQVTFLLGLRALLHTMYWSGHRPGWIEHDAQEICRHTLEAIRALLQRNCTLVSSLLCVSITNQREIYVVFDR